MTVEVLRVLVVADASAFPGIRRSLWPESFEVVAATATSAPRLLQQVSPDVVLLDLALTQMDAVQLVARLVAETNAPVLALASGALADLHGYLARAAGASDVIECVVPTDQAILHALSSRIVAVAAAARARRESQRSHETRSSLRSGRSSSRNPTEPQPASGPSDRILAQELRKASERVARTERAAPSLRVTQSAPYKPSLPAALRRPLAIIGASTGGTLALNQLLRALPASAPPVLVVQHMLPEFTSDFAERLNEVCAMRVHEAQDGELLRPGHVLIAPGGRHLRLERDGQRFLRALVTDDAPVGKHRPSIDVLFQSCAEVLGSAAIGVLLTGMGDDGARGLLALRSAGARTIVQDQASSACFGMPAAAIECGAAQEVLSLAQITRTLAELYSV